ncbi:MAG: ribbon-helix-helix protein, CopG family [Zavarzinella sp.]|nr:ribbon-helix-helix protein, CopG family [Zavarzinella sp.]
MSITLPENLEQSLARRAELLGLPVEELVRRAVSWYLQVEPELEVELRDWQQMTWHAWATVEESLR